MPLSPPTARRSIHRRVIDMEAYARDDGLFEVESRLVDTKPFPFLRVSSPAPVPADQPLHDLSIRVTLDADHVIRAIEASSDVTPFPLCRQAEATLSVLVGEKIARGWSALVKQRLRGTAGCTHLMEMLLPLATTALAGIKGADPDRYEKEQSGPGAEAMVDSCFAYSREREVIQQYWPQFYRPRGKR